MRPVPQTRFGENDGDCFAACLASLLEVSLEEVPPYHQSNQDMRPYLARVDEWLAPLGLALVTLNVTPVDEEFPDYIGENTYSIAAVRESGDASFTHAIVMRGREPRHDPHPQSLVSSQPDLTSRIAAVSFLVSTTINVGR